ncbi:RUN domain-containing protein 1-like isoform X3 [Artemia franciscana]|uniref:RUN domain-containing protein 1-like isoform X2 n=1 Tax=Artemia franciscana TaxID=6661 RepID=UPI0032DBDD39
MDKNLELKTQQEDIQSSDEEHISKGERWAPVGATDPDSELGKARHDSLSYSEAPESWADFSVGDSSRLIELEEEQEQLNNALLALTTHFAQVQFRLRQIVEAPLNTKEDLLKELESFASRGIPDPSILKRIGDGSDNLDQEQRLAFQKEKQQELMEQLKAQLQDLEQFAYESGDAGPPQMLVMERQKFIIEELRTRMNLNVDNIDKLSPEELKCQVNNALAQLVDPLKVKDQLLSQLRTQVTDLERFIEYLQGGEEYTSCKCSCTCPVHGAVPAVVTAPSKGFGSKTKTGETSSKGRGRGKPVGEKRQETVNRISHLLQMLVASQLGCGVGEASDLLSSRLRPTAKGNHWGDIRARLELAINRVCDLARVEETVGGCDSDDSDWGPGYDGGEELTKAVRKELASVLRDLMQHGLCQRYAPSSLVPILGCFQRPSKVPAVSGKEEVQRHAWDLILHYYEIMDGSSYVKQPQRSLANSFRLDPVGSAPANLKQSLLTRISSIVSTRAP